MLYPEFDEEYNCSVYEKMKRMLQGAEKRSLIRQCDFNLDLEYMVTLYVEICPILGIDICWNNCGSVVHGSPSLDRVDNQKGYVKGNVQVISHRANTLKKDYLLVEWEIMSKYMQSGGGLVNITEQHYKRPLTEYLDERDLKQIKKARQKGESAEEIALTLGLPFGVVGRYINQNENAVEDNA
jgi:hypothetical protein